MRRQPIVRSARGGDVDGDLGVGLQLDQLAVQLQRHRARAMVSAWWVALGCGPEAHGRRPDRGGQHPQLAGPAVGDHQLEPAVVRAPAVGQRWRPWPSGRCWRTAGCRSGDPASRPPGGPGTGRKRRNPRTTDDDLPPRPLAALLEVDGDHRGDARPRCRSGRSGPPAARPVRVTVSRSRSIRRLTGRSGARSRRPAAAAAVTRRWSLALPAARTAQHGVGRCRRP